MPDKIQQSFYSRLKIFIDSPLDPKLRNHSVDGVYPECRSINITGDYRAIFREENEMVVFVLIGRHSELYG